MKFRLSLCMILVSLGLGSAAAAKELVSDATIRLQKDSTSQFELSNKLPVTYRQIPQSDILLIDVAFSFGEAYLSPAQRPGLGVLMQVMERGSVSYPKDKLFGLLEKYATGINCGVGIELGSCSLATLNSYVDELMPALASVIKEPAFDAAEVKLMLEQTQASEAASLQNPESYVNEVVNAIFYGRQHPYWLDQAGELKALAGMRLETLKALHRKLLEQTPKRIIVVGSMPEAQLKVLLEKNFAFLKNAKALPLQVPTPPYDPKKNFAIGVRDIPTSYIRAKFVAPGFDAPDMLATQLMLHILSEELENEIRTKRSLSYSVYAQIIPYTMGIGVIHASTSKPRETMEALKPIIQKLREQKLDAVELERYKTVFATGYFLNLEEHSSLAASLMTAMRYLKGTNELYEMPRKLAEVKPEDIQKAAQRYLKQFRLGVVYKDKGFSPSWAEAFLQAFP